MHDSETGAHPLDHALALSPSDRDRCRGQTSPAYANMVGPFGGTTAATLLAAVLAHDDLLGDPVALTVNFAAPVADGGFELVTRALRTNRSTQHWAVEMHQQDAVVASATAVTALRRDTWGETDAGFPQVPPPAELPPPRPAKRPPWTRHYDMRFVDGEPWGETSGNHPSRSRLWMRDEPPRPLDFLSLTALCDVFLPRIFVRRPKLVPIGTVSMTTYFHAIGEDLEAVGDDHVLGVAEANHFGRGFFDQSAEVWSPSGVLLASTHQVVYYKE
jgi:acyl-CoA thioesterase